jgi:hypothetical protein
MQSGGRKMADYAHRAARCADPLGSNPPYRIAIRLTALRALAKRTDGFDIAAPIGRKQSRAHVAMKR